MIARIVSLEAFIDSHSDDSASPNERPVQLSLKSRTDPSEVCTLQEGQYPGYVRPLDKTAGTVKLGPARSIEKEGPAREFRVDRIAIRCTGNRNVDEQSWAAPLNDSFMQAPASDRIPNLRFAGSKGKRQPPAASVCATRPKREQYFRTESFAFGGRELEAQNTFVQARRCQRCIARPCPDRIMRVVSFLNHCEAGKAPSTQCHLSLMAQNCSPFSLDFFGA